MQDETSLKAFLEELRSALGERSVKTGEGVSDDYSHDEALTAGWQKPLAVAFPSTTEQVSAIARIATRHAVPIVARGSGTGLSGGATPCPGSLLVSFEAMDEIIEIDEANHVAVVQPGVTLALLDQALAEVGFVYPVFPGELGSSLGGNVATNAGGMRAVKYGVTRHQVLGLEFVLAGGEVMRSGGKYVKSSSGYDLVQLIIGSEGTLALVTEITVRIYPRPGFSATMLVPFASLSAISNAVPELLGTGVTPLVLEYMDAVGLSAMSARVGFELGVSDAIKNAAKAYLFVILEENSQASLDAETETFSELLLELGALEVFLLNEASAAKLLEAREGAFWVSKALGANDMVDVVVPRAEIPAYLERVNTIAADSESFISAAGHVGDGNIHFSIFQPDETKRYEVIREMLDFGLALGGSISAEHGIGSEKRKYLLELEDADKLELMRRIKAAFDPQGILNPGKVI
ncbi:MAG: FAD-binding protein [Actinomycetota bacterium]|nr:FAD-binding protein [Actinomycetota bacterium]